MSDRIGTLTWISEFVVRARLQEALNISEQVWVGSETGERVSVTGDLADGMHDS